MSKPSSLQEQKAGAFLFSLREFEASIVARFLNAKDKLLSIALINKHWHQLVSRHYAWSRYPSRGPTTLLSDFLNFLGSFSELTGVEIPDLPAEFLRKATP